MTIAPFANTAATTPAAAAPTATAQSASTTATPDERPAGFQRVAALLAERGHPHLPIFLDVAARTAREAADALGVAVGQIAKSVVFRRLADDAPVLVIASGDRRVDEAKAAAQVGGPLGRANAAFVKSRTGFSIGGVAPIGHCVRPLVLVDGDLFRFDAIWAAAGHPNGIFLLTPHALVSLTGAPVVDVVETPADPPEAAATALGAPADG